MRIGWTESDRFANLTVSDADCVFVFASPIHGQYSGLALTGDSSTRRYTEHTVDLLCECLPIRTDKALQILCRKCGDKVDRSPSSLLQLLAAEATTAGAAGVDPTQPAPTTKVTPAGHSAT